MEINNYYTAWDKAKLIINQLELEFTALDREFKIQPAKIEYCIQRINDRFRLCASFSTGAYRPLDSCSLDIKLDCLLCLAEIIEAWRKWRQTLPSQSVLLDAVSRAQSALERK